MTETNRQQENITFHSYKDAVWKADLDPISKLILFCIDKYADNDTQSCFLNTRTMAKEVGCSMRTIFNKFLVLKDKGFLEIEGRYKNNEKISSIYWLILPEQFTFQMKRRGVQIAEKEQGGVMKEIHNPCERDSQPYERDSYRTYNLTSNLTNPPIIPQKKKRKK